MKDVYLLFGSNLGDRLGHLNQAIEKAGSTCGHLSFKSKVYETAAWGKTDQPSFLNQVVKMETPQQANQLLVNLLKIEQEMGRIRREKYSERIIDIDILYFGDEIIQTADLVVPHPRIAERRFVLVPMAEINNQWIDPVKKLSIQSLLETCPDQLEVKIYSDGMQDN
jgi:2-amino-4-hydroxy-6-hydroxymethyldihydropteridine diphosphokinase